MHLKAGDSFAAADLADREFALVIFDCDGVLVDSEIIAAECLAARLTAHGRPIAESDVFERFLGRSFGAVEDDYQSAVGRPLPDGFVTGLHEEVAMRMARELRPIEGVFDVIASLRVPCCVASSSRPERLVMSLRVTGLLPLLEGRVFDTSMVARGKPAPDLFLHAAAAFGIEPERALVLEDSVSGVRGAKAAGMTAWGFVGGSHYARLPSAALTAAGADRIFRSMADVGQALRDGAS
jgi:HAD superfamily hydrolase (TIGR01509 family)